MIIAIEGLIPSRTNDRRVASAPDKPAPEPVNPPFYVSKWMRNQQNQESADPQPPPAQEEAAPEPQSAPEGTDDPPSIELSSSRPVAERPAVPASLEPFANNLIAASRPHGRLRCSGHQAPLLNRQEPLWPAPLTCAPAVYAPKSPKSIEFYRILQT